MTLLESSRGYLCSNNPAAYSIKSIQRVEYDFRFDLVATAFKIHSQSFRILRASDLKI